jgi:hypothetical protein
MSDEVTEEVIATLCDLASKGAVDFASREFWLAAQQRDTSRAANVLNRVYQVDRSAKLSHFHFTVAMDGPKTMVVYIFHHTLTCPVTAAYLPAMLYKWLIAAKPISSGPPWRLKVAGAQLEDDIIDSSLPTPAIDALQVKGGHKPVS